MSSAEALDAMTREDLYSSINALKRCVNRLTTDLIRYESLSKLYKKYFNYLNEMSETIENNTKVLKVINQIKVFEDFESKTVFCFVQQIDDKSRHQL